MSTHACMHGSEKWTRMKLVEVCMPADGWICFHKTAEYDKPAITNSIAI